ncbi:hypothetical protein BX600DRAFT_455838 [Xylariales sp. PMI_506]|nr:hypothetical protein BX600DRAFT_455838 [Xylariales sp. PMI_506]
MALPSLKTIEDCADYTQTVEPFLPELYQLPQKLLHNVSDPRALLGLYQDTNPLISGLAISIFLAAVFLVVSEFNRNYSQVDRMWSILPTFYIAHFKVWSYLNGISSQRLNLLLLWSAVWSTRLTFNYWRKGGYSIGSEDYRWEIVRRNIHPVFFFILNVTFISFIQSVLLYFLAAPTYTILLASQIEQNVTPIDIAFTTVQLALVLIEWFSDQQQWDYQTVKKQYQKTAKIPSGFKKSDLDRGFVVSGLWAYCRHPNFTAEQTIWIVLYQWSCYATGVLFSWAGSGSLFLVMLFQGSTWLTELITANKYPDYKHYQRHVGMQIPTVTPYKPSGELEKKQN